MFPLLKPGDEVLIDPNAYRRHSPQPGDIVISQHPYQASLRIVKRVKSVTADGRYHLEGDNPAESTDSRTFGAIASENILGRVICRF